MLYSYIYSELFSQLLGLKFLINLAGDLFKYTGVGVYVKMGKVLA